MTPEEQARTNIDGMLTRAGWVVQDADALNLYAGRGIAVREFPLKSGHGYADYLLYVDRTAAGVVEAKPEGYTLKGVEAQSEKYSMGLPEDLPVYQRPLPFLYESTGVEPQFTNELDPEPRSRSLFSFHTPAERPDSRRVRQLGRVQDKGARESYRSLAKEATHQKTPGVC